MHLEADDAVFACLGTVVDHLGGDLAVDAVGDMVPIDDDDDIVPFADRLDLGFDFGVGLVERRPGALVFGVPDGLFAAFAHDAAAAGDTTLVIDDAGVGIARVDVGLIAADMEHLGVVNLPADLKARVAVGSDPFEAVANFEVGEFLRVVLRGEQDQIGLLGVLLGLGALDRAVHNGPVAFETFPAGEVLAVEKRNPAVGAGGGDLSLGFVLGEAGIRKNAERKEGAQFGECFHSGG